MDMPLFLSDTATGMVSTDYKERFIAEYEQLVIRYNKLKAMLKKWDAGQLEFIPNCPRGYRKAVIQLIFQPWVKWYGKATLHGVVFSFVR